MTATPGDCNDQGQFYVTINFAHINTSDSFRIQGNGHMYGHFSYNQLPVVLGPFNGSSTNTYEFGITDLDFLDCHAATFITPPYCGGGDCAINEMVFERSECDDSGHYNITINFQHQGTGDSFEVDGYGHFSYNQLPITLHGFVGNGQYNVFHISDIAHPDCGQVNESLVLLCAKLIVT